MATIRYLESADVAVPRARAFAYRLDFQNLTDYNPNISNLRRVDGGIEPGGGAEYLFDLNITGMGTIESPLKVIEVVPNDRIVFDTGPAYMARETCVFTDTPDGTHLDFDTTLTIDGEIDEATATLLETSGREQVRLELDHLKKILES